MCVCLRFEIHKKQGILVYCCIDLNFDGYTTLKKICRKSLSSRQVFF